MVTAHEVHMLCNAVVGMFLSSFYFVWVIYNCYFNAETALHNNSSLGSLLKKQVTVNNL